MDKCEICKSEWKERYNTAVVRFDKALTMAYTITIISVIAAITSIILAALCVAKTHEFIAQFECVEETLIEQDGEGQNVAVVIDQSRKGGK